MLAVVTLDNFTIGILITIIFAIISAFVGLIVYIFNSKTEGLKSHTEVIKNAITKRVDGLEKKMEPIPAMQEKIAKIEEIDFPTKEEINSLREKMALLSDQIRSLEEESTSIIKETPDKYQTRNQCRQNVINIESVINRFIDENRMRRKEDLAQRRIDKEAMRDLNFKVDKIIERQQS